MILCPTCNTPGAYVGLSTVECVNTQCEHFKASQKEETAPTPYLAEVSLHETVSGVEASFGGYARVKIPEEEWRATEDCIAPIKKITFPECASYGGAHINKAMVWINGQKIAEAVFSWPIIVSDGDSVVLDLVFSA